MISNLTLTYDTAKIFTFLCKKIKRRNFSFMMITIIIIRSTTTNCVPPNRGFVDFIDHIPHEKIDLALF